MARRADSETPRFDDEEIKTIDRIATRRLDARALAITLNAHADRIEAWHREQAQACATTPNDPIARRLEAVLASAFASYRMRAAHASAIADNIPEDREAARRAVALERGHSGQRAGIAMAIVDGRPAHRGGDRPKLRGEGYLGTQERSAGRTAVRVRGRLRKSRESELAEIEAQIVDAREGRGVYTGVAEEDREYHRRGLEAERRRIMLLIATLGD